MDEREGGAVDGGQPGPRHLLRALGPLLGGGIAGPLVAAALPAEGPLSLAAVTFLAAAGAVVVGPLLGTARRPLAVSAGAAAGAALSVAAAALVLAQPLGPALAAGLVVGAFLLLLAGLASALGRVVPPGAAVAVTALLGALSAASFHLGDPFLEWGGSGSPSRLALDALHLANPLSAAVGSALELDWLRLPIMYSGYPGTGTGALSAAQYYEYAYSPWWAAAAVGVLAGTLLLLARSRKTT